MSYQDLHRRSLLAAGGLTALAALSLTTDARPAGAASPGGPGPTRSGGGPLPAAPPEVSGAARPTPGDALARLLAGNRRFAGGRARHPRQGLADLRRVARDQRPFAVTLGCADSRVPPELLFDQGLGDLFDNRVAGNVVDDLLMDSVSYAVGEFGCRLVVVLGHERCGAVTATVEAIRRGRRTADHGPIVRALWSIVEPVLDHPGDPVENAMLANVRAQAGRLRDSSVLGASAAAGDLLVVGARYDLDTGRVRLVDPG